MSDRFKSLLEVINHCDECVPYPNPAITSNPI